MIEGTDVAAINRQAQRYLARREHGVKELRQKLLRKGYDGAAVDKVLLHLKTTGWLSDRRFQHAFVRHWVQKGYGPSVIWARLEMRCEELLQMHQLDDVAIDWLEVAYRWVVSAWRSKSVYDYGKISQALYRRGFDSDHITKTRRRLKEEEAGDR